MISLIPSKTMRDYLKQHPVKLSIMQRATLILSELVGNRPCEKQIELLSELRSEAETSNEEELLDAAISDLKRDGYIGKTAEDLYNKLFKKENDLLPEYPFYEICNLPVLFEAGDVVSCANDPKLLYYIANTPHINERSNFTDESYYCYDLNCYVNEKFDLFVAHRHVHVCQAERRSTDDLSARQLRNYNMINSLLSERNTDTKGETL